MKIKTVHLSELIENSVYTLSFPIRTDPYERLSQQLSPLPLIVVTPANEIISGIDYYYFLKEKHSGEAPETIDVMESELPLHDALILNFNLKEKLTELNLYEKLVFIKKVVHLIPIQDIYRKTNLDIGIDKNLMEKLDILLTDSFRERLIDESITLKTALQICNFRDEDREPMLKLFHSAAFTSSHQQKIVEMTEEIIFREKIGLLELFDKLGIFSLLENEKPQKKVIDMLFKYRFPMYQTEEDQWLTELKQVKLPGNARVTHYPFFEKKEIEITMTVKNLEELKNILNKIKPS